jgi:hypothetical protein
MSRVIWSKRVGMQEGPPYTVQLPSAPETVVRGLALQALEMVGGAMSSRFSRSRIRLACTSSFSRPLRPSLGESAPSSAATMSSTLFLRVIAAAAAGSGMLLALGGPFGNSRS